MKYWLSHLPLEVWVEVFVYPWISRKKLAKIVDRFRNRKFAEFLQFFLHDWGKQTLGALYLEKKTLPNIPKTPIPENIKFFKHIAIRHFDIQIIGFLRRISTLFNANQVNLDFHYSGWAWDVSGVMTNYRAVLDHLAPMLHEIHSLCFNQDAIPLVEQYFGQKLALVKMITIHLNMIVAPAAIGTVANFCLNWLTSAGERDPAEPRFLKIEEADTNVIELFSTAIQKQFRSAKSPRTFAIDFIERYWCEQHILISDFHLENNNGEQLHRRQSNQYATFQIFRHHPNAGAALEEWVKATVEKSDKSSVIQIGPIGVLTIGQIDANPGENGVDDGGEKEEEDQPIV